MEPGLSVPVIRIIRPFLYYRKTLHAFYIRYFQQTAFRKKGIRVNCVCPGGTDTDIYKSMERMELTKEQKELASNTPKQR